MVTRPFSTITGTLRRPPEYVSICRSASSSFCTLKYVKAMPRLPYSSRAAVVYGQVSLPKIKTMSFSLIALTRSVAFLKVCRLPRPAVNQQRGSQANRAFSSP